MTAYDVLGRVTGSSLKVGTGTARVFGYTYNLADFLTSTTYPSQRVVTNTADRANRISAVTGTYNGVNTPYVSGISYAPQGAFSGYALGNTLGRSYVYNQRQQVTEITDLLGAATNPLLDLQLYWGTTTLNGDSTQNNGNLTGAHIGTPASGSGTLTFVQQYGYDGVNRLTSVTDDGGGAPNSWSENFGYDRYGNMWLSSYAGLPNQPSTPTVQSWYDAATNRQAVGGQFDTAGNQQAFAGFQLTYDSENRIVGAIRSGNPAVSYAYDGLGQRVTRSFAGGATTVYVYDAFGNLAAEYADTPAAAPCGTCYLSTDHLGSVRMVTDAGGSVVARHDFLPFGVEIPSGYGGRTTKWAAGDAVTRLFTGHDRAATTENGGLDFFGARYYSSDLGRFTSPDPRGNFYATRIDPQSWNLYTYARNNPLKYVDPNGYGVCTYDDGSEPEVGPTTNQAACESENGTWQFQESVTTTISFPYEPPSEPSYADQVFQQVGQNLQQFEPFMAEFAGASLVAGGGVAVGLYATGAQAAPSVLYGDYQASFNFGASLQVASTEVNTVRVSSGLASNIEGAWSTTETITSSSQAQSLLALPPGNPATAIGPVTIMPGTAFISGTAAPLFGQPGGGFQILAAVAGCTFGPVCVF